MELGMAKRSLTGIKPTGIPHIANYIGAIRPALALGTVRLGPGHATNPGRLDQRSRLSASRHNRVTSPQLCPC